MRVATKTVAVFSGSAVPPNGVFRMSWLEQNLNQETCLTCQHFKLCPRRVKTIGSRLFIEFDKSTGGCGLFNNFPTVITKKPHAGSFCHYKRWVELP